jgi:hypothetical protein
MSNQNHRESSLKGDEPPNIRQSGLKWVLVAAGALLWLNALVTVVYIILISQLKIPLSYPEGAVVDAVWRIASAEPLYLDWRNWPHIFSPYGPLLYYPIALLIRLTDQLTPGFHYFQYGRFQSLACLGLICIAGSLIARRAGCNLFTSLTCSAGFLTLWPRLLEHTLSFRPDAPMVLFNLTAVWIALGGLKSNRRNILVILCLWLASGFKPQGLAAPLTIGLMACHEIGWKKTMVWIAVYFVGALAAVGVLNFSTGGLFLLNTWHALPVGMQIPTLFGEALTTAWIMNADLLVRPIFMVMIGVYFWNYSRILPLPGPEKPVISKRIMTGVGCYCVLSTLISLVQLFKVGSDVNYLLEPFALTGVAAAILVRILLHIPPDRIPDKLKVLTLIIFALTTWSVVVNLSQMIGARRPDDNFKASNGLIRYIVKLKGETSRASLLSRLKPPVLLMDHAYIHPDPEAHSLNDPYYFAIMVNRKKVDPGEFIHRIRTREFDVIALSAIGEISLFEVMDNKSIRDNLNEYYTSRPDGGYPTLWHKKPE